MLDAHEKLAMKVAYVNALREGVLTPDVARDPYELLMRELEGAPGLVTIGRLEIETWLTPRPGLEALGRLGAEFSREFLDAQGCKTVSARLREFVRDRVLPLRPMLVGVDHSLTGGVLEALCDTVGGELSLVVLDSHFDAIPAALRKAAAWKGTPGTPAAGQDGSSGGGAWAEEPQPDSYNCGTWLARVIDGGIVAPENVAVVGVSDRPGPAEAGGEPEAMEAYRDAYLEMEARRVKVIPKGRVREQGARKTAVEALEAAGGSSVYLSVDADIGAGEEVKAVRFLDTIGLAPGEVVDLCGSIAVEARARGAALAGFDLMEIDVHLADIPGSRDRTVAMCAAAAREILAAAAG